jgi:hypothetical protein
VVRSWRLVGSIRSLRRAGQVVLAAPVLVLSFASAAIGEALGYALGTGDWVSRVDRWELEAARLEAIGEGPTPVPSTAR